MNAESKTDNWLVGHQRQWVFERILLVARGDTAEQLTRELEAKLYTVECVATPVDALRRIMHSDYEAIVCYISPDFPADMFHRCVERVRPYLTRRFVYLVNAETEPRVMNFVRKVKIASAWHPGEAQVLAEVIAKVIEKTTALSGLKEAAQVEILATRPV